MRALPPARSPLDRRSLLAGLAALLRGSGDPRRRLADALGPRYEAAEVRLTDSGTTALRLALSGSIAVREGFVALPAWGCYDLATAAIGAGARVRLYDLAPDRLAPEPGAIERLVEAGASAVVAVHYFGLPAPVERMAAVCRAAGCTLIEDAAQEAGARIAGRRAGAFGDVSVLSFGRGKGTTGGSGGALLTRGERGAAVLGAAGDLPPGRGGVRDLAVAASLWALARPGAFWIPRSIPWLELGESVYRPPTPPAGMSRAAAAIVADALRLLEAEVAARRRNADRLRAAIGEGGGEVTPLVPAGDPGWLRLPVLLSGAARAAARAPAASALGIVRSHPLRLHELRPLADSLVDGDADQPGAERLAGDLHTLPTHGGLAARDLQALEAWVRERVADAPNRRSGA